ncbi:MAG TPA: hypothetical protein PKV98_05885 [Burkholderiaceae bacterium]|nr:hypothetical protein [Burkholderiaceae bacterium]
MTSIAAAVRGLIAVLLFSSTAWAAGDPPAPPPKAVPQPHFTVEPQKFELTPGQSADTRVFILVGNGLPEEAEIDQVRDVTKQDGSPVKATFTLRGGYGGGEPRRWSYVAEFAGLGSSYSQKRQLGVLLKDKREYFVDYELTNRPSGSADYTLTYDDKWFVDSAQGAFKLTVKANDHAVGPLTLANSTLAIEKRSTTIPVTALALCANRDGQKCDAVPALKPNTPTEIYLRVASSTRDDSHPSALPPGSFNGKLKLDAPGVTAAKEVSVNVISTRPRAWLMGMGAILAGVLLSMYLLSRRYWAAQLAAYQPLFQANDDIKSLLEKFAAKRKQANQDVEPKDPTSVESSYRDDIQKFINNHQPQRRDFWKAFVGGAVKTIDAAATTDIQNRVQGLRVMVLEVTGVAGYALQQIEEFASSPQRLKTEQDALAFVKEVRDGVGKKALAPKAEATPTLTMEEVSGILVRSGGVDAAFFVLVATLVGYFVLIDDKPGFGTLADYILCFFWGLGVPATVQGVKDITKDKLGDAISVKVPVLPGKTGP